MVFVQIAIISCLLFSSGKALTTCTAPGGSNDCTDEEITDDIVICVGELSCQNAWITATERVECQGENSCRGVSDEKVEIDAPYIVCSGAGSCGSDELNDNPPELTGNVWCAGGATSRGPTCQQAQINGNAKCSGSTSCQNAQIEGCAECSGFDSCLAIQTAQSVEVEIEFGSFAICSGIGSCHAQSGAEMEFNGKVICSGTRGPFGPACSVSGGGEWEADDDVCCTCSNPGTECCGAGIDVDGDRFDGNCPFSLTCDVIPPTVSPTTSPVTPIPQPTSNPTTSDPTTAPTTPIPTPAPIESPTPSPTTQSPTEKDSSDSGSDSDDDSSDDSDSDDDDVFSAFSYFSAAKSDNDNLDELEDANGHQMKISLSDSTLVNLWLMLGVCFVVNAAAYCMCWRRQKVEISTV